MFGWLVSGGWRVGYRSRCRIMARAPPPTSTYSHRTLARTIAHVHRNATHRSLARSHHRPRPPQRTARSHHRSRPPQRNATHCSLAPSCTPTNVHRNATHRPPAQETRPSNVTWRYARMQAGTHSLAFRAVAATEGTFVLPPVTASVDDQPEVRLMAHCSPMVLIASCTSHRTLDNASIPILILFLFSYCPGDGHDSRWPL